jgi:hypothetical protein
MINFTGGGSIAWATRAVSAGTAKPRLGLLLVAAELAV